MSIVDKIAVVKQVLTIVLKISEILLSAITTVMEKIGEVNNG